jgi:hypothetical protein
MTAKDAKTRRLSPIAGPTIAGSNGGGRRVGRGSGASHSHPVHSLSADAFPLHCRTPCLNS